MRKEVQTNIIERFFQLLYFAVHAVKGNHWSICQKFDNNFLGFVFQRISQLMVNDRVVGCGLI